jgi:hypothetical protein
MFNGDLIVVFVLTTVLGFAMAAVSYALIESPCRNALRRWEYRRAGAERPGDEHRRAGAERPGDEHRRAGAERPGERLIPVPPLDSSVTDDPEPSVAQ